MHELHKYTDLLLYTYQEPNKYTSFLLHRVVVYHSHCYFGVKLFQFVITEFLKKGYIKQL